jgi:hypothetical protein
VAGRFLDLQGLRQAVAGVGLLMLFAWEMFFPISLAEMRAAGGPPPVWSAAALIAGWGVVGFGIWWTSDWYKRRYGRVEQTWRQRRWGMVIGGTGVLAFLIPFNIENFAANLGHPIPVNLQLFTMAVWIFCYWIYLGRPFVHYLVFAGVALGLGLLSFAGIPPANFVWHLREATLFFALASIVGGVIDHRILTRALSERFGDGSP